MSLGDWRDVSVILLSLEALVIGLIYGAIFYFLWKGSRIAHRWLANIGLPQGRRYAALARWYTTRYSKKTIRPFVTIHAVTSETTGFLRALFSPSQKGMKSQ